MRINPVISAQYNVQPSKSSNNISIKMPTVTTFYKSNDIAFTGIFFRNLSTKLKVAFANKPGDWDKRFHKVLEQASYGDGVPLVGFLRNGTISSTTEHKEAIKKMLDTIPHSRKATRSFFEEALEVIDEKMNPKKKS